jgi:NADP-reducing hydrogenase subunit HndC
MRKTVEELESIRKETLANFKKVRVMICSGTGCTSSKSGDILNAIEKELKELKVNAVCSKTGCFGFCAKGPIIVIEPEQTFYEQVKVEDAKDIAQAIKDGTKVERLMPKDEGKFIEKWHELNFYNKQVRRVLRNCGYINPENIDEYLAMDGYKALEKVVKSYSQDQVIDIVLKSGLRGRGGAGFPTGKKWLFAKNVESKVKYVCCNADEGDPGAFMDRSILEGDPNSVLEAMAIAGYAIGSSQGYIYVRAEYPIAVHRLSIAIEQAKKYGLLGKNIFGTDFSFNIELRLGAGAFVCGEETALMQSIEGKRGEPRPRPPFPAVKGLFGKPTILNNAETLSNVPQIILNGPEWFASIGTEGSKSTKVFALGGNVNNIGLVEVPMGTTLREIVYDIGGGIPKGKKFKAAQTGGPSGGCIPAEFLDTPIDFETLKSLGSMMGSGSFIIMDDDKCMVNIAKFFLEFTVDESCGKCAPCRIGTKRMHEILTRITEGKGTLSDIDKLEKLAKDISRTSLCGLGQTAPNPVLSTLKYFKDEYLAHINDKKCPAGECKALSTVKIDPEKCKQCGLCQRSCPNDAIEGTVRQGPFKIIQEKCIKCMTCVDKCPFKAISSK